MNQLKIDRINPGLAPGSSLKVPQNLNSASIISRPSAGEGVKSLEHLRPVDMCHAQPLGAAPQLAAVLGGDDDAVGHHTDFNLHPVGKSRLFRVVMQKQPPVRPRRHRAPFRRQREMRLV